MPATGLSLDIDIRVYAVTRTGTVAIREDIYLRINDIVAGSGSGFAFPSQTLYMGHDDGLDEERGEAAMEVAAWRRSGRCRTAFSTENGRQAT